MFQQRKLVTHSHQQEEKIQFIAGDIARFNAELAAEAKKGRQNDWLKELLKSEENVR